jgi:transcriptional regulator with XRE-family HTH domain
MSEVIRQRRTERGMSQKDLATAAGVDVRQIRRYEAGEQQPLLSVAVAIADALGISVTELAGKPSHQVSLSGQWWASWQTSRDGEEKIATQQVEIKQEGDLLQVATVTRGLSEEEGGYHWSGELRLWDNELLMGWYASTDGSIRSKGTMYFVLHPHGLNMVGRWVGLDGPDPRAVRGHHDEPDQKRRAGPRRWPSSVKSSSPHPTRTGSWT